MTKTKKTLLTGLGLAVLLRLSPSALATPHQIGPVPAQTVYVSPTGSDSNPGTLAAPFLTVDHARQAVQPSLASASGDTAIILRGGTYTLTSTLTLTAADGGQNGHKVVYEAFPGEKPVLSGGQVITGWTLHDSGKNIWQASAPGLSTRQLFVNGVRCQRARSTAIASGTAVTSTGYTWGDASLSTLARPQDLEMVMDNIWTESRCPVASVSGTTVTMAQPAWNYIQTKPGVNASTPTWIENAYEFLSQPGQWYDNSSTSTLYYIPRTGENLSTASVVAPMLTTLLSVQGTAAAPVLNVSFQGIAFEYAGWTLPSTSNGFAECQSNTYLNSSVVPSAYNGYPAVPACVSLGDCYGVLLTRCLIAKTGTAGLALGEGAQGDTVQGCVLTDTGGSGVEIGIPAVALHSDSRAVLLGDTVKDNWIHDCCQDYRGGCGIIAWYTSGLTLAHNQINSESYTGISCGWGWGNTVPSDSLNTTIAHNLIYGVAQVLNDGGGIYLNSAQPGLLVFGNVIHDVPGLHPDINTGAAPPVGLYTDNGSRYDTLQGNIVYATGEGSIRTNDNRGDTSVQYNTFTAQHDDNFIQLAAGAGPNIFQNNFAAQPSSDPSVLAAAGLEPAYLGLLSIAP